MVPGVLLRGWTAPVEAESTVEEASDASGGRIDGGGGEIRLRGDSIDGEEEDLTAGKADLAAGRSIGPVAADSTSQASSQVLTLNP